MPRATQQTRQTGQVTQDSGLSKAERQVQARLAQQAEEIRQLSRMSDEELIAQTPGNTSFSRPLPQMEMSRRLKDAVEALTAETIKSRESSERLIGQLDTSIASLTDEIVAFRESSDNAAMKLARLTHWLIGFTAALVFLTVVLVVLTAVLSANG
jgi:hypothetical protein